MGELELVDAFAKRALALAGAAAAPNTRRSYATAYRAFAAFLHARYGEASVQTFTVSAVSAWRDVLTAQGLAARTLSELACPARQISAGVEARSCEASVRRFEARSGTQRCG